MHCWRRRRRRTRTCLLCYVVLVFGLMWKCCFSCNLRIDSIELNDCGENIPAVWSGWPLFLENFSIELFSTSFHIIYHAVLVWFRQCSLISRIKPLYLWNKEKLNSIPFLSSSESTFKIANTIQLALSTLVVHCAHHCFICLNIVEWFSVTFPYFIKWSGVNLTEAEGSERRTQHSLEWMKLSHKFFCIHFTHGASANSKVGLILRPKLRFY